MIQLNLIITYSKDNHFSSIIFTHAQLILISVQQSLQQLTLTLTGQCHIGVLVVALINHHSVAYLKIWSYNH